MDAGPTAWEPAPILDIGGQRCRIGDPGFSEAVASAYASGRRPRCLCSTDAPEMYIARFGQGYVVKRMPATGSRHAPTCPSFEPPAEMSGLAPLLGTAIKEDPVTGMTTVRLDFALSEGPSRSPPSHAPRPTGHARARPHRLSLRGLLHYLWDQAGLTKWHPGFEGKRTWATVRRRLLDAADQTLAAGQSLGSRLYVPEPFSVEAQDEIQARRRAKWSETMRRIGANKPLALLVGEVKEFAATRHGYKAVIKHVPEVAFALDANLYKAIGRCFPQELDVWAASPDIQLMVIATIEMRPAGVPAIKRLYPMPVNRQWLPVDTISDQQLVEKLVHEGRAFTTLLRYDLPISEKRAHVALIDGGTPERQLYD